MDSLHCKPKLVGPDGLIVRKRFKLHPVVISAKRYEAIKGRSRQDEKHAQLAAVEEERRYRQYLKDGNDALVSLFTDPNKIAEVKVVPKEDKTAPKIVSTKQADERIRKERIIRANKLLNNLKPGPRALQQALLLSEMIHQRQYNEALNAEIAENARRQEEADEALCPAILVPFGHATEEEEKAREEAKNLAHAKAMREDIARREKLREAERDQRVFEEQVDRAQYKCLQEKEEKAAKEKKARKIAFYRKALKDAVEEKAEIAEHERICDAIDDRRNCVYIVANRHLESRYGTHVKQLRQKLLNDREKQAIRVSAEQEVAKKELQERMARLEDHYAFEVEVDENRRQCERQVLASQRRAYQKVEKEQNAEKMRQEAELQRFQIATRLKNMEANRFFNASQKRKQEKAKKELKDILFGQRDEFLARRREEMMNLTACNEDPYLEDDKLFFEQAVDAMEASRKVGRPLYPLAQAVERYESENLLDMKPEGRLVKRSQLRDYCWPGFFSKAELAYRKYEQREKCREEQVLDRHQIFCNSVKIKKLAEVEKPYVPCIHSCPINCFHRRGVPAADSTESFDYGRHVCYEETPMPGACPGPMQTIHNDPLDNCRKISSPSIHLPPMPPITRKDTSLADRVASRVHDLIMTAKDTVKEAETKKDPEALSRAISVSKVGADAPAAASPPSRDSNPPLPKSQPPVRRRTKRSTKRPTVPATWNDVPAPIPNPGGTWGDGSLPQPAKAKPKTK
ncbi:trichohyalin [Drosophila bipectinata]|uniref:trichohyalin n=1 Tax=Drosophila bipectinata TaxID=42026 RepID=UPI001C89BFC1|nr:trichohyalin [Drosophila bipectinata]